MVGNRKFIIDTMSEVYNIMKPYSDDELWDLGAHETQINSIYLLGRKQLVNTLIVLEKWLLTQL